MNCTELDAVAADARRFTADFGDAGFAVAATALGIVGLLLVTAGEHAVRPLGACAAASAAGVAAFAASGTVGVACELRLGGAAAAAIAAAMLASCVLKTGLFLLGATSFGAGAHLTYGVLPVPAEAEAANPVWLGRSVYYYAAIGAAAGVGAVLTCTHRGHFARIVSSLLGAACLAALVHLCVDRARGTAPPAWALLVTLVGATLVGVTVQERRKRRRRRGRSRWPQKKSHAVRAAAPASPSLPR